MTVLNPNPCYDECVILGQIKKNKCVSVFWVTGLKILGRVVTHIFKK